MDKIERQEMINRVNKEYKETLKTALLFCYKKHSKTVNNILDDVKKKMAAE